MAFKELLHFVYVGTLSPAFLQPDASIRALVDLLIVGDKFEVGSLMGAVLSALFKRKQTVADDVVLALKIPDALEQYPEVKALIMEARARVVETFKDVDTWPASLEFLTLGQDVVSFLLQSEELEATTEEEIFKAVLVWVKNNYTERVARQQAMSRLSQHIRFGCIRGGVSGSDRAPSFRDGPSGDPRAGHVGDILPGVFRQCKAEVEGPFWPDQEGSSKPKPAGLLQLHDGRSRCFKEFPKGSLEGQAMGHSIAEGSQGKPPHCWLILGTKQTAQQGGRNHTNQMRVQVLCTGVATWLLESSKGFPVLFCRLPKAGVDFQMS